MKVKNPFLITGYVGPEYFCDREKEVKQLLSAIHNHRSVTLFSLRRMGKTGLLDHVFTELKRKKKVDQVYIDILGTANLKEMIQKLGQGVIGQLESTPEKIMGQIAKVFKGLRPSISLDEITGKPTVDFNIETEKEAVMTLEQIFAYLKKSKRQVVIAIDEFQQIVQYPEGNIEAILRSNIQRVPNVNFIFSVSHKHLLLSIFADHGRPFYQSTEMVQLDRIPAEKYMAFIADKFAGGGFSISEPVIEKLLEWTRGHTFYVQYACNKLYGRGVKKITEQVLQETMLEILKENESIYYSYRNLLRKQQFRLLRAIGREGGVQKPSSKEFIKKYDLSTTSTVNRSMKALIEKEMVYKEDAIFQVYDVFLSRWLEQL